MVASGGEMTINRREIAKLKNNFYQTRMWLSITKESKGKRRRH